MKYLTWLGFLYGLAYNYSKQDLVKRLECKFNLKSNDIIKTA